jgi:hypothetical protein
MVRVLELALGVALLLPSLLAMACTPTSRSAGG